MLAPYLNFNGNTKEAVLFYAKVFHLESPRIMTFGQLPNPSFPINEAMKDRVLHAQLEIGGGSLMFSDARIDEPVSFGDNITLMVNTQDPEELKGWFEALSAGGTILMPLQPTFFAPLYGQVKDKFGITWQLGAQTH